MIFICLPYTFKKFSMYYPQSHLSIFLSFISPRISRYIEYISGSFALTILEFIIIVILYILHISSQLNPDLFSCSLQTPNSRGTRSRAPGGQSADALPAGGGHQQRLCAAGSAAQLTDGCQWGTSGSAAWPATVGRGVTCSGLLIGSDDQQIYI